MQLYNTRTQKKEEFIPHEAGKVKMYTCGPTVYHYAHIGNLRSYIMEDMLEKALRYLGYDVTRAMNITDVGHLSSDADTGEDKMLKGARRDLADAQTKIEQLRGGSQTGEDNQLTNGEDGLLDGDAGETGGTQGNDSTNSEKIDWLDLTGHTEVAVKPNSVYDKYYIY